MRVDHTFGDGAWAVTLQCRLEPLPGAEMTTPRRVPQIAWVLGTVPTAAVRRRRQGCELFYVFEFTASMRGYVSPAWMILDVI